MLNLTPRQACTACFKALIRFHETRVHVKYFPDMAVQILKPVGVQRSGQLRTQFIVSIHSAGLKEQ